MTIGVFWEFFEYGMDTMFGLDMQKDEYVTYVNTVTLDPDFSNKVIKVDGIEKTISYNKNNNQVLEIDGYLDIGLHDTMKDLIVNFMGAFVYL